MYTFALVIARDIVAFVITSFNSVATATPEEDQLPSSQAPTATCTMDNTSVNSETAAQSITKVVKDYQALAIVLPIALLTIIINALLVGVSVYICVFLRGQKENNKEEDSRGYENLEWSSMSLELNNSAPPVYINTQSKR